MLTGCLCLPRQILKPEPITDECLQGIREQAAAAKKIEPYEIKAIIVVLGLLVLWIAGNWIPVLNATVVALIGLTVMFLPGMQLLSWKEFQDAVPWASCSCAGPSCRLVRLSSLRVALRFWRVLSPIAAL